MVKSGFSLNNNVGVNQLSHLLLPLLGAKTIQSFCISGIHSKGPWGNIFFLHAYNKDSFKKMCAQACTQST